MPENQQAFYNESTISERNSAFPVFRAYEEYRVATALAYLPKGGSHLDIGCGEGDLLMATAQKAGMVAGFDISDRHIELAKQRSYNCPSLLTVDALDTFQSSERYDLITAIEVIEHLDNPLVLLECIARHLAPSGTFVISTPNWNSLDRRVKRSFPFVILSRILGTHDWRKPISYHVKEYTIHEMRQLLADYLSLSEIKGINVFPYLATISKIGIFPHRLLRWLILLGENHPSLSEDIYYIGGSQDDNSHDQGKRA